MHNNVYCLIHRTTIDNMKKIVKSGYLIPNRKDNKQLKMQVNYLSIIMKKNIKHTTDLLDDPNVKYMNNSIIFLFNPSFMKDQDYYINFPALFGLVTNHTYISPQLKQNIKDGKYKDFVEDQKELGNKMKIPVSVESKITKKQITKILETHPKIWNELCVIHAIDIKKYLLAIMISKDIYNKHTKLFDKIKKSYKVIVL